MRSDSDQAGGEYRGAHYRWPREGVFIFNPHETIFKKRGLVDGLVPAFRRGDYVGLYRCEKTYYGQGMGSHSDWASWDDGKKTDWTLVRIVNQMEVPSCSEDFYPKVRIIANGNAEHVGSRVTFKDVIALSGIPSANTITYRDVREHRSGILGKDESVIATDGMIFDVADTSNA
jgi:hypothetical protein